MRRNRNPYARGGPSQPVPESITMMRRFDSDANPSRPIRPSPLTRSAIPDMPLDMLERIRSFPLFMSAPESFLVAIGSVLKPQTHQPHDYVITEGDEAKAMYWLVRGAVAVTSRDGESVYAELKPGAFFGEIGILMNIPRTATIVARTKCLLLSLKKEDLVKELPNFPQVEASIRDEATERLAILERKKRQGAKSFEQAREMEMEIDSEKEMLVDGEDGHVHSGAGTMSPRGRDDLVSGSLAAPPSLTQRRPSLVNNSKKRKSPSPGIVELAATSALGSGEVNIRQTLQSLPLFAQMPSDLLHFLGSNAQTGTYQPFKNIIEQDSIGRDVFFIIQGEVEVLDFSESRSSKSPVVPHTKARLRAGSYFGEVASLSLAPRRTATVRSVTYVECLVITGEVLNEFWKRCPPDLKREVEETAKKRLSSFSNKRPRVESGAGTSADMTAKAAKLSGDEIEPAPPGDARKLVQFMVGDGSKQEPLDPDPYAMPDFETTRSRSRRSSLNPLSDAIPPAHYESKQPSNGLLRPGYANLVRRPATLARRPSQYARGLLPDKVLARIFSLLDFRTLCRLRAVSRYWFKLIKDSPLVFRILDLKPYNLLATDKFIHERVVPLVGDRPRIIDISNCFHITDDGFKALASSCATNVVELHMKSVWEVSAAAIHEMVQRAPSIEVIDLSNCRKVNDALLMHIVGNVNPSNDTKPKPATHVVGAQKLRKIVLSYCKHVTDRSMAHLAYYARTRLEELDLTRCTTIYDHGFEVWGQHRFSRLAKLCLADCTYLTDNSIVFLTQAAPNLQYLDLSFCCALSDTATEVLALHWPRLRFLSMSYCGSAVGDSSLKSISLHLLQLRYLSVRGCVRVTGSGVEAAVDGCQLLETFDVSQCKNLVPWLRGGGMGRVRSGVRFELMARDWPVRS